MATPTQSYTVDSIVEDVNTLLDVLGDKVFVAGGCARFLLMKEWLPANDEPNDIDLFHYNKNEHEQVATVLQELGYTANFHSFYALTFAKKDHIPVQLIKPLDHAKRKTYGSVAEVLKGFTLDVERFGLDRVNGESHFHNYSNLAEGIEPTGNIHYDPKTIDNPISAALRMNKYGLKGYTIERKGVAKLFEVWDTLTEEQKSECKSAFLYDNYA